MRRASAVAFALGGIALLAIAACTRDERFAAGRERFLANRLDEALPLFEAAARATPGAERQAWLAETYRRLGRPDDAAKAARRALELDACDAYAHEVLANLYNPLYSGWEHVSAETTWVHARAAVACDPAHASAWLVVWLQAMLRGERAEEERALSELATRRFFTPAALAFGRWLLSSAPLNAVLIVNGDMDTYPLHVLQASEGLRPDVAIVNLSLLNAGAYRRVIRDRHALPIPDSLMGDEAMPARNAAGEVVFVADAVVSGWAGAVASGTLGRPLAIATTVPSPPVARERLVLDGPRWIVTPARAGLPVDTAAVRTNLFTLEALDFTGPWVSEADRSPIRRIHSPGMAHNLLATANHYVLAVGRDSPEATAMRDWAIAFVRDAGLDAESRAFAAALGDSAAHSSPEHP